MDVINWQGGLLRSLTEWVPGVCDAFPGISLIYFLCLLFAIYQKYEDLKEVMYWLDPELRHWEPDEKVGQSDDLCATFIV